MLKIETPKFTIDYKGAKFTFKYGTDRDGVEIVRVQQKGWWELLDYFSSRLVSVEGLELDGKAATVEDVLSLPRPVLGEIITQWMNATFEHLAKTDSTDSKKKKSTRKSKKG